jgi:hypothetical protein
MFDKCGICGHWFDSSISQDQALESGMCRSCREKAQQELDAGREIERKAYWNEPVNRVRKFFGLA